MQKHAAALAALLLMAAPALAQRTPSFQGGTITPGDIGKFQSNGQNTDAGNTLGDANGKGVNPFSVLDRGDNGLCFRTGASGAAHNALCIGHDAAGNGIIDLNSLGGLGPKNLYVRVNGTLYDLGAVLGTALSGGIPIPDCPDTGGQHLNFAGGVFSCGTTGGSITLVVTWIGVPLTWGGVDITGL